MEVGDQTMFVAAPGYYEKAKLIRVGSMTTHDVDIILESRHSPVFPSVANLSPPLRTIFENSVDEESAETMFLGLTDRKKAAALNILAKMDAVKLGGPAVLEFVDRIESFAPDRIHARLTGSNGMQAAIDSAIADGDRTFTEVSGALHKGFDAGSYKTYEGSGKGNLQLSFAHTDDDGIVLVDADIDIYTDVLLHMFGEVFVNHLTNTKTDPFKVYNILTEADIQPEYELRASKDS